MSNKKSRSAYDHWKIWKNEMKDNVLFNKYLADPEYISKIEDEVGDHVVSDLNKLFKVMSFSKGKCIYDFEKNKYSFDDNGDSLTEEQLLAMNTAVLILSQVKKVIKVEKEIEVEKAKKVKKEFFVLYKGVSSGKLDDATPFMIFFENEGTDLQYPFTFIEYENRRMNKYYPFRKLDVKSNIIYDHFKAQMHFEGDKNRPMENRTFSAYSIFEKTNYLFFNKMNMMIRSKGDKIEIVVTNFKDEEANWYDRKSSFWYEVYGNDMKKHACFYNHEENGDITYSAVNNIWINNGKIQFNETKERITKEKISEINHEMSKDTAYEMDNQKTEEGVDTDLDKGLHVAALAKHPMQFFHKIYNTKTKFHEYILEDKKWKENNDLISKNIDTMIKMNDVYEDFTSLTGFVAGALKTLDVDIYNSEHDWDAVEWVEDDIQDFATVRGRHGRIRR